MNEIQTKFLLQLPKTLNEEIDQACATVHKTKSAFIRECIRHRLKDISGEGTDCQPTAAKEDHIVGRFEALFKVLVPGVVALVGLMVTSFVE